MSENIEILQQIGAQKIHKQTHIPLEYIEAILQEDYTVFSKLQYLGFINILQREYNLDLSAQKEEALLYFQNHTKELKDSNRDLFLIASQKKRNVTPFYIGAVVVIFLVGIYISFFSGSTTTTYTPFEDEKSFANNTTKIIKQMPQEVVSSEENTTKQEDSLDLVQPKEQIITENNETVLDESTQEEKQKAIVESFVIKPKTKVWLGYIDVKNGKKMQKTFSSQLSLDPQKEWLLVFGHNYINIYINGELQELSSKKSVRFHYKDGLLSAVSKKEFKDLNKGRLW